MSRTATVWALTCLFSLAAIGSPVITVQPGESIQAAIEASPAGATIQLPPGTWRENIAITKDLVLKGQGPDSTLLVGAKANQPVIMVVGPQTVSVTLEGLKISGGQGECIDSQGLLCPHGVLVAGKARLSILSCEISGNVTCGLFATGEAGVTAIRLSASGNGSGVWAHARAR